jgi:hypothetical protein
LNDGDNVGVPIGGLARYQSTLTADQTLMSFIAGSSPVVLKTLDGHRCADWSGGGAFDGNYIHAAFRPNAAARNWYLDVGDSGLNFRTMLAPYTPKSDRLNLGYAFEMSAMMRKINAGDATDCRFSFGIRNFRANFPSRRTCWAGFFGDGAQGFRFGSVNCPDSFAGGAANNAATDADAGSVQPTQLVNPGTSWMLVRIKVVPATPTMPARWAGYLNNERIQIFDSPNNFPRGHIGVSDQNSLIEGGISNLQGDTVGLHINCPAIDLLTFRISEDFTL